jgi:uncharacterized membrane protein
MDNQTSNTKPETTPAPRMRRGLRILLTLSLALNLLVVGVVIGGVFSGPHRRGEQSRPDIVMAFVHAMPRQERRALGRRIRDARHSTDTIDEGASRQNQTSRQEILQALSAQPFDRALLENLVAAQQRQFATRDVIARTAFLEYVSEMSDSARKTYAERVAEQFENHRKRRRDR